jgi:hypothetical protein
VLLAYSLPRGSLPSCCLAMNVYSDFTIPAFGCHVTIYLRVSNSCLILVTRCPSDNTLQAFLISFLSNINNDMEMDTAYIKVLLVLQNLIEENIMNNTAVTA